MRIAMYTDSFYPNINGVSTAVLNLAQMLARHDYEVLIQSPRYPGEQDLSFLEPNISVHYVKSVNVKLYPDYRIGSGLPLSLKTIRQFRPDIIHVHTPVSIGLEGTLIAKALRVPALTTFHTHFMDEDLLRIFGVHNQQMLRLIKHGGWRFSRSFCQRFDGVIAPSRAVAKELKAHGVTRPTFIAPNILEEHVFSPRRSGRKKLTRLLYVGRLSKEKRLDITLRAFAHLRAIDPHYELILIGDGPERSHLFDLGVQLGVSHAITWYGAVDHEKLIDQRLYHLGDVFILSSKAETQGLSTLEAMAHSLPVVAVRSPANQEVVGPGGILVPNWTDPERAAVSLAKAIENMNQGQPQTYHQLAYKQSRRYSADELFPTFDEIYHSFDA